MSIGVVVAITSLRPAARCSSNNGLAKGAIASASGWAAIAAAWCTRSRSQPLARRAPWRLRSMAGRVSPIVLKTLKTTDSSGLGSAPIKPTWRRASLMKGPDAPVSRVRSRSKKAAPGAGSWCAGSSSRTWLSFTGSDSVIAPTLVRRDIQGTCEEGGSGRPVARKRPKDWRGEPVLQQMRLGWGDNSSALPEGVGGGNRPHPRVFCCVSHDRQLLAIGQRHANDIWYRFF